MKQHAVITGGGTGIGLAIAKHLGLEGYHTWLVEIDAERGERAREQLQSLGITCQFVQADVEDWTSAGAVLDEIPISQDSRTILVNNAAARSNTGLLDESPASWSRQIGVMLSGTFAYSQALIARVRQSQGSGAICNLGSVVSQFGSSQSPAYHAAKAGVVGLTRYLAVASGRSGADVRVNCVEPGLIVQDRHLTTYDAEENAAWRSMCEAYQPGGRVGGELDVARAVSWLCGPESGYLNGAILRVDGGGSAQEQFTLIKMLMQGLD